ncbi:MAG: hypothetical protein WC551_10500 [Patescibacteria group bacterium]
MAEVQEFDQIFETAVDGSDTPTTSVSHQLSSFDDDELASLVSIPSIDIKKYQTKRNIGQLFGQGLADSLVSQFIGTPATISMLVGRLQEEHGEVPPGEEAFATKVGKKIRNFEIALRNKMQLSKEEIAPTTFGEGIVQGTGGAAGSILGLLGATMSGGGLAAMGAKAVGASAKNVIGTGAVAGLAAGYGSDYLNEKAALGQELMDAGYKASFVDHISDLYAFPTAALDFASFKFLGRLLRPKASEAAKIASQRALGRFLSTPKGQVIKAVGEGIASEGGTEAVQQQMQSEFEIGTKLKDRNFLSDLTDDTSAFIIGSMIGSTAGVMGQRNARKAAVDKIVKATGLARNEAALLHDESVLLANDIFYDELSQQMDVSDHMKWVEKAFAKIEGKKELAGVVAEAMESEQYTAVQGLVDQIAVDEQSASLARQFGKAYEEQSRTQAKLRAMDEGAFGVPPAKDQAGTQYADLQAQLQKAQTQITELKKNQGELIAKSPTLRAIQEELDSIDVKGWKDATPKERRGIEERVSALSLRLQNPGTIQETVKAAEGRVSDVQTAASKNLDKIQQLENDLVTATAEDSVGIQEQIKTLEAEVMEQTKDLLTAEHVAEGFRQEVSRLEGKVSFSATQVRTAAKQSLRNILEAYKAGRKLSEQEFKGVQKAFVTLLNGSNLSRRAISRLLRSVLTIRTADQFNAKIGVVMDGVNTILRSEKVKAYQDAGRRMIEKMLPNEGRVSPKTQAFAEHLKKLLNAEIPFEHSLDAEDVAEVARAQIEQAVYDLKNAGDDVGAAERAAGVMKGFFKDQLQQYADFKSRQQQTYTRLANLVAEKVGKGVKLDAAKEGWDATRQQDAKGIRKGAFSLTPYTRSFMSILNAIDPELARNFSTETPFQAWVVLTDKAKTMIDGKMEEIYGANAAMTWAKFRQEDFLNVDLGDKQVNISRAAAMSLWMTTKMPAERAKLLKQGVSEAWLQAFERGDNVNFTKQDYQWMQNVRETLDYFANEITPVYEQLRGRPFRKVDNYFMVSRYLNRALEEGGVAESSSVIQEMLNGKFDKLDPTDEGRFKEKVQTELGLVLPDIYQAVSMYATDMNHFLAYANYTVRLQQAFQNDTVRRLMDKNMPPSFRPVIDEFIDTLAGGSVNRTADRKAMKGFFQTLGWYARSKLVSPKQLFRQFSAISAFTRIQVGKTWIGAKELVQSTASLPEAVRSGELRELLDTAYMRQRFQGMFEYGVQYVEDIARQEWFRTLKDDSKAGKVRQALASKQMHNLITASSRYGDRWASVVGGWSVYKEALSQGIEKTTATKLAIRAIEDTQQSMDPGKAPVAFGRNDLPSRLLTLFQRTPAIYFDQYLRMWEDKKSGKINNEQFIRQMATFHLWIPMFEALVTAGDFEPWEMGLAVAAGPFAYHVIFAQFIRAVIAGVMEGASDNEAELPAYLKEGSDGSLISSATRDATKALKAVFAMVNDGPDYDNMWGGWKAASRIGDMTPLPTSWLAQTPEGVYDLLQLDPDSMRSGMMKLIGYPESRTKSE